VPKKEGTVHHPLANDARSLLWLANQNSITIHVWPSRVPKLYYPDICIFDLDPAGDDGSDILRATALALRDFLADLGLPSWIKTGKLLASLQALRSLSAIQYFFDVRLTLLRLKSTNQ